MKKRMIILLAVVLLNAMPALADHLKGASPLEPTAVHTHQSEQCAKECDQLLKSCAIEVDSIQQRIQKIKSAIEAYGAKPENLDELRILNKKLKEANETMRALTKPGH